MNKTFDNIYNNVLKSFSIDNFVNFYLKLEDIGPKNNKGVNYIYHKNNREEIESLINKYELNKELIFTDFLS